MPSWASRSAPAPTGLACLPGMGVLPIHQISPSVNVPRPMLVPATQTQSGAANAAFPGHPRLCPLWLYITGHSCSFHGGWRQHTRFPWQGARLRRNVSFPQDHQADPFVTKPAEWQHKSPPSIQLCNLQGAAGTSVGFGLPMRNGGCFLTQSLQCPCTEATAGFTLISEQPLKHRPREIPSSPDWQGALLPLSAAPLALAELGGLSGKGTGKLPTLSGLQTPGQEGCGWVVVRTKEKIGMK